MVKACLYQPATGARVSNTYATCPATSRDNREKFRLIRHNATYGTSLVGAQRLIPGGGMGMRRIYLVGGGNGPPDNNPKGF